jgi:hypothetical protein
MFNIQSLSVFYFVMHKSFHFPEPKSRLLVSCAFTRMSALNLHPCCGLASLDLQDNTLVWINFICLQEIDVSLPGRDQLWIQ